MFNFEMLFVFDVSDASPRDEHTASTWFRFERQQDDRGNTMWAPVEVRLDKHDNEADNRVFVQPDHSLMITSITKGRQLTQDLC